jgi:hypothetical protein
MTALIVLVFGGLIIAIGYIMYNRIKAGTYKADETMFSQAGVTVYLKRQKIALKGREFTIDAITNVRTEPPKRDRPLAYDCVISLKDFSLPEHRIRFVNSSKANQFMQRLVTAIEKAGGPSFR